MADVQDLIESYVSWRERTHEGAATLDHCKQWRREAVAALDETIREACEVAWEEGYAQACVDHGGYDGCATASHGQRHINPFTKEAKTYG